MLRRLWATAESESLTPAGSRVLPDVNWTKAPATSRWRGSAAAKASPYGATSTGSSQSLSSAAVGAAVRSSRGRTSTATR